MSIELCLQRHLSDFSLDVSLTLPARGVSALFGPSGSGKTTVLRALAGLERLSASRVVIAGMVWQDEAQGIFVPPRGIGYVPQDGALFPHLTVEQNIAFGLTGKPAARRQRVQALLEQVELDGEMAQRWPHQLSGGQQQRVSLARALAQQPRLMLLDEPFSALDVVTRRGLREEIKSLKGKLSCPIIYVTHDINEALFLADEILPVVDGKIDRGWMQRTITREPGEGISARGAREPRLSLVY